MTMMLGKELLSGLWVRPECRSYCCHSHFRSCLTSCLTFFRFSPLSLRHGVVVVCFEVPGWMLCRNGCSLWSLGSWLGGSPVSALSFVASFTLLYGPLVFFRVVFVLLLFLAILMMTHKMSSCISFPELVAIPLLCVLFVFWCCCVLVCFVCLFAFFWFVLCLMGLLTGLCIGPLPALLRLSTDRRPCMIIYNSSFCCGWTCVTTWRKPWRRWTEKN